MTSCGKMSFISKKQAASYLNSIKAAKNRTYKKQHPYKCNRCEFYHTTRLTKKQQRTFLKRIKGVMV